MTIRAKQIPDRQLDRTGLAVRIERRLQCGTDSRVLDASRKSHRKCVRIDDSAGRLPTPVKLSTLREAINSG